MTTATPRYRKRPGLNPNKALEWYSGWIQLECTAANYADVIKFYAQVMSLDCSKWIGHARIPSQGWEPASEAATHPHQLIRHLNVNHLYSKKGLMMLDFELQARFVPFAAQYVSHFLHRNIVGPEGLEFRVHMYIQNYPEWTEIVGEPEPEPPPPTITKADWTERA